MIDSVIVYILVLGIVTVSITGSGDKIIRRYYVSLQSHVFHSLKDTKVC